MSDDDKTYTLELDTDAIEDKFDTRVIGNSISSYETIFTSNSYTCKVK